MENKNTFWRNYRFPIVLLGGIFIGSILGIFMGKNAVIFKPFGDIFLNLMFTAVVPLVFVTISSAVGSMVDMRRLGKIVGNLFLVFVLTGLVAAIIIIITVKIFPPAEGVKIVMEGANELKEVDLATQIVKSITVSDFVDLFSKQNMLPLIFFSILFGICVSLAEGEEKPVSKMLSKLSDVLMKLIELILWYAPIGLGAYFAALIGEFGPQLLGAYAKAMAIYYPICVFYFFVAFSMYSYIAAGKDGFKIFYKNILNPSITSLATQSSIATLPISLNAAKNMGVPKDIREIVLPIGATMHMDGTVLSSILKISFLFGIFGHEFAGIDTYVLAIIISVLGGVVMSGVPGGGLIGEMLIVTLFGFPMEAFPVIATIGFLVDPPATWINATGDCVASMLVTRSVEGKDWLKKQLDEKGDIVEI